MIFGHRTSPLEGDTRSHETEQCALLVMYSALSFYP